MIKNSYCRYESHGSIYFDTTAFSAAPNHYYAKIVPEAFGDMAALKEGEGKKVTPLPIKCHLQFAADDNFKFCHFFKNNK